MSTGKIEEKYRGYGIGTLYRNGLWTDKSKQYLEAAMVGDTELCLMYISKGVNPSYRESRHFNALHFALGATLFHLPNFEHYFIDAAEVLALQGADIYAQTLNAISALDMCKTDNDRQRLI